MPDRLSHFYEFGPFRLDAGEKLLYRGQNHVQLTLKAFEMLLLLVQRSGQVVAKNEIMDAVWPQVFVQESTLTQNIFILRRALGRGPDGSRYIETVPRRGYRFCSSVREGWLEPSAASQLLVADVRTPVVNSVHIERALTEASHSRAVVVEGVVRVPSRGFGAGETARSALEPASGAYAGIATETNRRGYAGDGLAAALEHSRFAGIEDGPRIREKEDHPMPLMVTELELSNLLNQVAFTRNYGFVLHSISDGECTIEAPFQEAFERPGGIVSGQVFMAAADVAMWLAVMTKLGMNDMAVTAEQKTTFLAPAKQEDFLCTAKILKLGRRLIYGTAECVSMEGTLLAHHTLTYIRK